MFEPQQGEFERATETCLDHCLLERSPRGSEGTQGESKVEEVGQVSAKSALGLIRQPQEYAVLGGRVADDHRAQIGGNASLPEVFPSQVRPVWWLGMAVQLDQDALHPEAQGVGTLPGESLVAGERGGVSKGLGQSFEVMARHEKVEVDRRTGAGVLVDSLAIVGAFEDQGRDGFRGPAGLQGGSPPKVPRYVDDPSLLTPGRVRVAETYSDVVEGAGQSVSFGDFGGPGGERLGRRTVEPTPQGSEKRMHRLILRVPGWRRNRQPQLLSWDRSLVGGVDIWVSGERDGSNSSDRRGGVHRVALTRLSNGARVRVHENKIKQKST